MGSPAEAPKRRPRGRPPGFKNRDHHNQKFLDGSPIPPDSKEASPRRRLRCLPDGDVRLFAVADDTGALVPLPDTPGFEDTAAALRWLGSNGASLAGKRIAVMRFLRVVELQARTVQAVTVVDRPRVRVADTFVDPQAAPAAASPPSNGIPVSQ